MSCEFSYGGRNKEKNKVQNVQKKPRHQLSRNCFVWLVFPKGLVAALKFGLAHIDINQRAKESENKERQLGCGKVAPSLHIMTFVSNVCMHLVAEDGQRFGFGFGFGIYFGTFCMI